MAAAGIPDLDPPIFDRVPTPEEALEDFFINELPLFVELKEFLGREGYNGIFDPTRVMNDGGEYINLMELDSRERLTTFLGRCKAEILRRNLHRGSAFPLFYSRQDSSNPLHDYRMWFVLRRRGYNIYEHLSIPVGSSISSIASNIQRLVSQPSDYGTNFIRGIYNKDITKLIYSDIPRITNTQREGWVRRNIDELGKYDYFRYQMIMVAFQKIILGIYGGERGEHYGDPEEIIEEDGDPREIPEPAPAGVDGDPGKRNTRKRKIKKKGKNTRKKHKRRQN